MQAATVNHAPREQKEQARVRALVRFNGVAFHSLAVASFLEMVAPLQAERICRLFGACPQTSEWIEQAWSARREALGRALRAYIETIWPEFDWNAAYQEFVASYRPRTLLQWRHGSLGLEALGLCAAAAQAALFYRTLSRTSDDPALRELARTAAAAHSSYFDFFRDLYERCRRRQRVGIINACRTVGAVCRSGRDTEVAMAFQPLAGNWNGAPVAPALSYAEYRRRTADAIRRHAGLGPLERLLFRAWLEGERGAQGATTGDAGQGGWWRTAPQAV